MKQALLFTSLFIYVFFNHLASYAAMTPHWQILDNSKQPIKGAVVIVYNSKKTINKKLVSDSNGFVFKDIPSSISAPWTLVISSPNFITKTVLDIQEKEKKLNIYLTKKQINKSTLTGKTSQFSDIRRDGLIDFGLTLFSVNLSEVWNITATDFFSTKIVPVPTFSRVKVPANISLPNQTERYWLSIRLKKDSYELSVPKKKKYIVHTLHGQFPLKAAIKKIQGRNSFIALANLFKFKAYSSQEKNFMEEKNEELNFDLSKKTIDGDIQVTTNVNTELQEILLLSLLKKQNQYLPFDIKRLTASGSLLAIPKAALNKNVLGLLTEKNKNKLTNRNLNPQTEENPLKNLTALELESRLLNALELNTDNIKDTETELAKLLGFLPEDATNKLIKTQSEFLTARKISIALQKTIKNQVHLKFLPLIATPKINNDYVSLELPTLQKDFKAHSSLLQLIEIEEIFIDKNKAQKILTTKILEEVGISKWTNEFNINFAYNFKKDPNKRYAIQIIFLATTGQSSEPSHATRSLQELL